ncbi:chaperone modulator CbpM [Rhodospirillum centenum]|uniref:Chaperone modulatory protein CbpM n=1 Tax=Rhodospirillum centenum (strain ATCC 51521 / SW) TaxID=414684 RepID=B6IX92_RHOCS|nr:chaperone modulator CbpM [Rhodospirillum centenum]ACJ00916.1 conserved hypothetical protein [Rhodospirillum centenum SW]
MIRIMEFAARCGVAAGDVDIWVERRWLLPLRDETGPSFSETDLARARLIVELERDLGIDPEAMPVVLSLLDQVHGLRRRMRLLTEALMELPEPHRTALCRRLLEADPDNGGDSGGDRA